MLQWRVRAMLSASKEKSICPLGCFGARMDGRRSITEPVLPFRSRAQGTRQTDISRISTSFLRKLSTGPQRKRRTPRGNSRHDRCDAAHPRKTTGEADEEGQREMSG